MSRIPLSTEGQATEETTQILTQIRQKIGMVPNVYAVIGHSPASLANVLSWAKAVTRSGLTEREVEQLNLHIADLNGCSYCVSAHATVGRSAGLSPDEVDAARAGRGNTMRENALLAFGRRVVRTGGARAGSELNALREAGVSDAEIIDVLAVVALNAFRNAVNIVAQTEIDFPRPSHLPTD